MVNKTWQSRCRAQRQQGAGRAYLGESGGFALGTTYGGGRHSARRPGPARRRAQTKLNEDEEETEAEFDFEDLDDDLDDMLDDVDDLDDVFADL